MGLFGFFGFKKAPSAKELRAMLPSLHSFVDVTVRDGPKGQVCIENTGSKSLITSALPGMKPGQQASFVYQNTNGKYSFRAALTAVDAKQATFEIPMKIDTIQKFHAASKRKTVRIDTTVTVQWRYSSTGKIESEWQKGVLSDISRTGASLAADKEIKTGNVLELSIPLAASGAPTVVRAEAKRVDKIEGRDKFTVGLAFHPKAEAERAIIDFINRRQVDLRNRGLG
jgi:hypothetical protein